MSRQPTKCSVPATTITPFESGVPSMKLPVSVYQHPIRLPVTALGCAGAPVSGSAVRHGSPGAPAVVSTGAWMPDTPTVAPCASAELAQANMAISAADVTNLFIDCSSRQRPSSNGPGLNLLVDC